MSIKIKRFLKISIITLLVIAVIAGTCYLFYSRFVKSKDSFATVTSFVNSKEQTDFNNKIVNVNAKSGCNRFTDFLIIQQDFENITYVLNGYLTSADDYDIDETKIIDSLNSAIEVRNACSSMLKEYETKCDIAAPGFNPESGANDLYAGLASYYVTYAKFLQVVDAEINKVVDKTADVKFALIDVYLNMTIQTYSQLITTNQVVSVFNASNIKLFSNYFELNNSYVGFDVNNYMFINNYNACNKAEFANKFAQSLANDIQLNGDKLNDAMYYFKAMEGLL
ncbi:MAG: hypothetical protein IKM43_00410 [Clostridia bacterium]|nr:hypothetical protein [Clostridia bacterium]